MKVLNVMSVVVVLYTNLLVKSVQSSILDIPEFLELGTCVEVKLHTDFEPEKFTGLWFDIMRVPNEYQEGTRCISQIYTWTGSAIKVSAYAMTEENERSFQEAIMTPKEDEDKKAFMEVVSEGVPDAPYKVMWTDYLSTACVYSCLQYSFFRAEFAWIISRFEEPNPKSIQRCLDLFISEEFDIDKFVRVEQGESCDYHEEVESKWNEKQNKIEKSPSKNITISENLNTESNFLVSMDEEVISENSYVEDLEVSKCKSRALKDNVPNSKRPQKLKVEELNLDVSTSVSLVNHLENHPIFLVIMTVLATLKL